MKFIADLHIHSKYSRATSKNLDLENIYIGAQIKGITVVGTGDATHPGWLSELKEKLVPSEQGLYKLRKDLSEICDKKVPPRCKAPVRFILQAEISNIYKKNGKTRKNHNLIFMPELEAAEKFKDKLDAIGNIRSDGRPILGMDAKHLLEIALDISKKAFLIPAHIWTPWFSLLGSKSGFNSIDECFEDLSPHIFAVETGLSSDPTMNRMVSSLDGVTLVSNSDAHSPSNLGREANIFDTTLSYDAIRSALERKDNSGFKGTIEFYPEEGKYHLDGHRKCQARFWPKETRAMGSLCPHCERPLTLGVLNRVTELADRKIGETSCHTDYFLHRVPLVHVLSEILKAGAQSKKVQQAYKMLISKFGNELSILNDIKIKNLEESGIYLLPEGIDRMRKGKMSLSPGYDGEFGKILIFTNEERKKLLGQQSIFGFNHLVKEKELQTGLNEYMPVNGKSLSETDIRKEKDITETQPFFKLPSGSDATMQSLNEAQVAAVTYASGPMVIVAGPGTGKTLTLTHRIAFLIKDKKVPPEKILAMTFTNKAAREMHERLKRILGSDRNLPFTATLHRFCLQLLMEDEKTKRYKVIEESYRRYLISIAIKKATRTGLEVKPDREKTIEAITAAKQQLLGPGEFYKTDVSENKIVSKIYHIYNEFLQTQKLYDFEDLLFQVVLRLETDAVFRGKCQDRFEYVLVDEYQDLNQVQYRLIRALSPGEKNLCVIGDPNQSIYGFRGADYKYFSDFLVDYPSAGIFFLDQNYRSTQTILDASYQVINGHQVTLRSSENIRRPVFSLIKSPHRNIHLLELGNERAEADAVARTIEKLVGGTGYHAVDAGGIDPSMISCPVAFSDVAILYRTGGQYKLAAESLTRCGIPFQVAGRSETGGLSEVQQLISLFKVVDGVGHYGDFKTVLSGWQPGLGKETALQFCQWGLDNGFELNIAMHQVGRFPIPELPRKRQEKIVDFIKILAGFTKQMAGMTATDKLKYLIAHTRLERLQNENTDVSAACDALLKSIETSGLSPEAFFTQRALETEVDTVSFEVQKVTLMTIHAAKGLEFSVVFIMGCEDDLIPFFRTEKDRLDTAEERRLFFVAMTRAKQQLFLTWARRRSRFGKELDRKISPFISDMEEDVLIRQEPVYGKKRRHIQTQMKLF